MTIDEKLANETGHSVRFYKEGAFWIAYEKSAYALIRHKTLRVTKKYVKKVNSEITKVGFPSNVLPFFYSRLGSPVISDEFYIQIDLDTLIPEEDFEKWKSELAVSEVDNALPHTSSVYAAKENHIIELISSYPLAEKTPLEVMMFFQHLKGLISRTDEIHQGT